MLKGNYLIAGAAGLMGSTDLLRLSNLPGINVRAVDLREPKTSLREGINKMINGIGKIQ